MIPVDYYTLLQINYLLWYHTSYFLKWYYTLQIQILDLHYLSLVKEPSLHLHNHLRVNLWYARTTKLKSFNGFLEKINVATLPETKCLEQTKLSRDKFSLFKGSITSSHLFRRCCVLIATAEFALERTFTFGILKKLKTEYVPSLLEQFSTQQFFLTIFLPRREWEIICNLTVGCHYV